MISTTQLKIDTNGNFSIANITERVRAFVRSTGVVQGQVTVFYKHGTGAVFVAEHEAGIIADLQDMLERLVPVSFDYKHHLKAVDFNGAAHLRSILLSVSVAIPIMDGEMLLGTYQDILVLDDQTEAATRFVVVQVIGE